MLRKHAIIVIKNERGEYLQYYEPTWDSYLFLNCKIENEKDTVKIEKTILLMLGLKCQSITYKFNKIHTKFSVKDQINKDYQHFFYEVTLQDDVALKSQEFVINNVSYRWFNFEELRENPRIQEVNSDIVKFIEEGNL